MNLRRAFLASYSWSAPGLLSVGRFGASPRRAKTSNPESLGEAQSLNQDLCGGTQSTTALAVGE